MKSSLLKSLILVVALSSSLISCKDDEETQKNSFKYNQKEAEIGTAFGFAYGQYGDVAGIYGIDMEFFEKTFTIHYLYGYPDSLSGKGDALILTFLSNKETEIASGEYPVMLATAEYAAFTLDPEQTGLIVGLDAASEDEPAFIEITSGKVTVVKNGDEYQFTFNLNTNINTTITGSYKGKPVIFAEKKKKSALNQTWFPMKNQHV
jgi:hypothetical protein